MGSVSDSEEDPQEFKMKDLVQAKLVKSAPKDPGPPEGGVVSQPSLWAPRTAVSPGRVRNVALEKQRFSAAGERQPC